MTDDQQAQFAITLRGYDREQVDSYVDKLTAYADSVERRAAELDQYSAELRQQLDQAEQRMQEASRRGDRGVPVGERVGQILALAEEEAETKRREADQVLQRARSEAAAVAEEERRKAAGEAETLLREARERAAEVDRLREQAVEQLTALRRLLDDAPDLGAGPAAGSPVGSGRRAEPAGPFAADEPEDDAEAGYGSAGSQTYEGAGSGTYDAGATQIISMPAD